MSSIIRVNAERHLRNIARSVGLDIHRYRKNDSQEGRLATMLATHSVNLVLDVGANAGQFAQTLRRSGYAGQIVSFEPLSTAYMELQQASRKDRMWEIAPRAAIGDRDGDIDIHISGNSVSSSVLGMIDLHASAAPSSKYVGVERAPLRRLDAIARDYLSADAISFLKIDTQGYEDRVLDGAAGLLDRIVGIQVELSFLPLYEGQKLFDALLDRIRAMGFSIWAIWPGFYDSRSGRLLQVDAVLFRN